MGIPFFDALVRREPLTQGHEILSLKTRVLGAANSDDFVILGVSFLIQCQGVTDGQTPRR